MARLEKMALVHLSFLRSPPRSAFAPLVRDPDLQRPRPTLVCAIELRCKYFPKVVLRTQS